MDNSAGVLHTHANTAVTQVIPLGQRRLEHTQLQFIKGCCQSTEHQVSQRCSLHAQLATVSDCSVDGILIIFRGLRIPPATNRRSNPSAQWDRGPLITTRFTCADQRVMLNTSSFRPLQRYSGVVGGDDGA